MEEIPFPITWFVLINPVTNGIWDLYQLVNAGFLTHQPYISLPWGRNPEILSADPGDVLHKSARGVRNDDIRAI